MAGIEREPTPSGVSRGVGVGVGVGTGTSMEDGIGVESTKDPSADQPAETTETTEFGRAAPVDLPSGDLPSDDVAMAARGDDQYDNCDPYTRTRMRPAMTMTDTEEVPFNGRDAPSGADVGTNLEKAIPTNDDENRTRSEERHGKGLIETTTTNTTTRSNGRAAKSESEAPSPRRYRLPPKPRLPLPPPLPPRRKPAGDGWGGGGGSAAGSSLGGDGPSWTLTSTSASSRFRKPPPLEVRAAAKTTTTTRPTTRPTMTRPTLPTTTTTSPTTTSPLASPRNAPKSEMETTRTVDRTTALRGEFELEFEIDRATTTTTERDETTMTTTTAATTVAEHPPARDSAERLTPDEKQRNVVAAAIADRAVEKAIQNVTTKDGNGTEIRTSPDETAALAFASPLAPPIHHHHHHHHHHDECEGQGQGQDEGQDLPDVESSRITECDALSDYQSYVLDEDVPPAMEEEKEEDAPSSTTEMPPIKALERPPEEEERSNEEKDVRLAAEASSLPEGWVEGTDAASGRTYYYHLVTNESAWDRPVAAMAGIEREPMPSAVQDGVGIESTKDPSADQPAETTETTEFGRAAPVDLPSGELPSDDVAMAARGDDQYNICNQYDNDDDDDNNTNLSFESLPPGWIEGKDPISGKTYYYDERTGESSWTLPAEAFAASCDDHREGGTSAATATAGEEGVIASSSEGEKQECGGDVLSKENEGREERDVAVTEALSETAMEASLSFQGVDGTSGPGPNVVHPDVSVAEASGPPAGPETSTAAATNLPT